MRFRALGRWALASLVLVFGLGLVAQQAPVSSAPNPPLPVLHVDNGPNSAAAQSAHYVVLVSLDGFRWDYAKTRFGARICWRWASMGCGRRKGCCRAIRRSRFPTTSRS
jgi:hypothetical protein